MQREMFQKIKKASAYFYLFLSYFFIVCNFFYKFRDIVRPLTPVIVIFCTIIDCLVFILINHVLVKRVVPKKILVIIEIFLIATLFSLLGSDIIYVEFVENSAWQ